MMNTVRKAFRWVLVRTGLVYMPDSTQVELHNVASVLVDSFPAGYVSGDNTGHMPPMLRQWLEDLESKYGDVVVTPLLPRAEPCFQGVALDAVTGVRCRCDSVSVKTWRLS